jgi:hypothetical protein
MVGLSLTVFESMKRPKILHWIAPLCIATFWIGCGGQHDSPDADVPSPGASAAAPSEEALVILAKADGFDGTEDKVVSKCLSCGLGMSGKAQHASTFGDYELHWCSEHCKEGFDAKPEQSVITAKLPESLK